MLSKSLGQILRDSAVMHILFHINDETHLPSVISNMTVDAAINFVEVCYQHTAFTTGRGHNEREMEILESGT